MSDDTANALVLRGRNIRFDENGLACLNDIHRAAGFTKNRQPAQWSRLPGTLRKIERVLELVVGKSHNFNKEDMRRVYRTVKGSGTYADVRLALDYAEYLNPKLAIEVKEVFLRYKAGDATLADEVLQRASAEDNVWAAQRAIGRAVRNDYTSEISQRGVKDGGEYGQCTNAVYKALYDKTARELKADKGLPANSNLRDKMDVTQLAYVAASEALSIERMQEEDSQGFRECHTATSRAASAIRRAIDEDRKDRQRRLAG